MTTALKYASCSGPWRNLGFVGKAKSDMRNSGEMLRSGMMSLVGRSDAAHGGLSTEGKCRLGYVVGLVPSSPTGPSHI